MPKQQKKVIAKEEYEESESDHADSATDEEMESEAEDSADAESGEEEDGTPAIDASATESDEDEDDDDDDNSEEDGDSEDDEDTSVKELQAAGSEDDDKEEKDDEDDEDDEDDDKDEEDNEEVEDDDEEDNEEVEDDEDVPKKKDGKKSKGVSKEAPKVPDYLVRNVTKQLTEKYSSRKGLQLFIRFPEKLPQNFEELQEKVKALSPLIAKVRRPRQKHARFCLVDFENQEDRDKVFKELSGNSKETKLVPLIPRTENDAFIQKLIQKRVEKIETSRANRLLKKEGKDAVRQKHFTTNLVVLNVPKSASLAQIQELFPQAVDIQLKPAPKKFVGVCTAAVTCRSTHEARENQKRQLTLGANKLIIWFDTGNKKIKKNIQASPAKAGLMANVSKQNIKPKHAPKLGEKNENSKLLAGKKRVSNGDEADQAPEKKMKIVNEQGTKSKPPQKKHTQSKNENGAALKMKQPKKQAAKENGNLHQKKGGATQQTEVKVKKQPPQKKDTLSKKQLTQKSPKKKVKQAIK